MHKMETSVCDQLPSTPPKLASNYSEYEESDNDRHYRCSPLVLKATSHFNGCHQNHNLILNTKVIEGNQQNICKNIDCEFQSSFTLDDINEKISTTQNTPTDEMYSKININHNQNNLTISSEFTNDPNTACNNVQSVYTSSDDNTTGSLTSLGAVVCCRESGSIYCCDDFENRIFLWVEENIPKMAKPEEKMEQYFENRRSTLIRSMSISLKQPELIQQGDVPTMDLSMVSSTSSIPPKDGNNPSSISKIASTPGAVETQSMKIIEGIEKYGSSLLKRRQSQVMQASTTNRLTQNKRLSIMTITQPFNKLDEKN